MVKGFPRKQFFNWIGLPASVFLFHVCWTFAGPNSTNAPSLEELGEMYFHGKGVPKDFSKSYGFFRQAADLGSGPGQSWVGYLFQTGQGVEIDYGEAVRWTKMAAEQGRSFDANRLAGYFWEGLGTPIQKEEALRWLKIAAEKGETSSQKQLPVWTAAWESEKKQKSQKPSGSDQENDSPPTPSLWRVAGPWKLPAQNVEEWFQRLSFEEVAEGLATGTKSVFLGEPREVLEVDAKETGNLASSLGIHANRVALLQGRWNAEKSGKALLSVGSDDAIKVWVNEKMVVNDWVGRKVSRDEDLYPIEFQRGENQIRAVLVNFKGPWGFSLLVPDEQGKAKMLAQAILKGDYPRTQTLLEGGADPKTAVIQRLPALELAQVKKRTHLEELLRSFGVRESRWAWSHYPMLIRILGPWFLPKNKQNPGHGFLLARGGKILFEHYSGLANVENKVAVGPHTKFAIGSVSKQFVAAAMFRLQEEKQLNISDPISKYLPDFPRGQDITLRQLLTHTSGIREYTTGQEFMNRCGNPPGPGEVYQTILAAPLGDRPGRRFAYSNSNYYLAGVILEKVSGESLQEILNRLFFQPLGMKDTQLAQGGATIENYATPYFIRQGRAERANTWNMDWAAGAGGIVSTPRDLFRWNEALWTGEVLRPESLKEIWRPEKSEFFGTTSAGEGYACGWGVVRVFGQTWIGHGGYIPPYRASLYRIPDLQITVVALTNAGEGFGMSPEDMTRGGACIFFGKELAGTVRDIPPTHLTEEDKRQRVGLYDDGVGVVEIFQKNERWYWQGSGFKETLRLAGSNYMIGQESGKILEMERREDGGISGIIIRESYFPICFKKLPPQNESEEFVRQGLAEYLGRYDFGKHGSFEVTQEDGCLYGRLGQQQKIPLRILNRDDFDLEGCCPARFSIFRDASGKVARADFRQHGMLIEAPKVK